MLTEEHSESLREEGIKEDVAVRKSIYEKLWCEKMLMMVLGEQVGYNMCMCTNMYKNCEIIIGIWKRIEEKGSISIQLTSTS